MSCAAEYGDQTSSQWAFHSQYGIQVPYWNTAEGNMDSEIIVAVVDGGIDHTHPDLEGIVYEFSEEEQKALGCGRYGYDAVKGEGHEVPADDHATHVAGIIAGAWNGFGISGVGSNIKIISVNCSVGEDTPLDYCVEAYAFLKRALEYGIPIRAINNSWGNVDSSLAMNGLIEECGKLGALSIFSAGNYNDDLEDTMFLPAGYMCNSPYAVIVGAHTQDGNKASFSSYGETVVDLFAPGEDILSAMAISRGRAYEYMNGTSMACPAVTGAAAYLAGNHPEASDTPSLRRLLLACARPLDATNTYYANGILDLSVDESGNYAPVIESLSCTAHSITVEGAFFGAYEGTVVVMDASCAGGDEPVDAQVTDWSDSKINIASDGALPALCKVYVESADNAKFDTAMLFTEKTNAVFEASFSPPQDYGQPDLIDSAPDYQAAGWMGGMDGYLYYLPMFFVVEDVVLAMDRFYRFDYRNDSWETLSPLPETLVSTQAAVFDGTIVITGVDRSLSKSLAYRYDPGTDTWKALPADNIPLYSSVVNCDGGLFLVGGIPSEDGKRRPLDTVYAYDPDTGDCTQSGTLTQGVWGAQAVYGNGTLYVYGHVTGSDGKNSQHFQRVKDGQAQLLDHAFPSFRKGEGNRRPKFNVAMHGALVCGEDGLYLIGPLSDDGGADTYLLREDSDTFEYHEKRLSDAPVYWPAAAAYDGKLFAIGRSVSEPGFSVFRATDIPTFETYVPAKDDETVAEQEDETATDASGADVTGTDTDPEEDLPPVSSGDETNAPDEANANQTQPVEIVMENKAEPPSPLIVLAGALVLAIPAWFWLRRKR